MWLTQSLDRLLYLKKIFVSSEHPQDESYLWRCSPFSKPISFQLTSEIYQINILTYVPVRSSVGQDPSWHALQVYSSKTYSFSLQGVQVQQQLTSPFRITLRKLFEIVINFYIDIPNSKPNSNIVFIKSEILSHKLF